MIQIAISAEDLAKIRFAISPMLTVIQAVRCLLHNNYIEAMRYCFETMHTQLGDQDLPALRLFHPPGNYAVDFMLPFPENTYNKFEDELETVANATLATIEADMAYLFEAGVLKQEDMPNYKNLKSLQAQAVEELAFFWNCIMQPHWNSISSVLEGDLMHHSREMMLGGAAHMFKGFGQRVKFENSELLTFITNVHIPEPIDPKGQGIVLMPNLMSHCDIWIQTLVGKPPVIGYLAYGAGLWNKKSAYAPSQALQTLIGENRARLLHALTMPMSTKDLAIMLELTPGAISQQLSQLKDAGLVDANRAGRSVYYYLNQRGEQLLNLLNTA